MTSAVTSLKVEDIWAEYQVSLKAFLYKNVSNHADVDDLLQDILIKTYQNLSRIKDKTKIKSWLFQIAQNVIIDFYRKRGRAKNIDEDSLWYANNDESILEQLSSCVMPFINGLPEAEALLLTSIELEGVSQKEFAEKNGLNYSTLKSRVHRSRDKLFELFNDCCAFSLDEKGNLVDFEAKNSDCRPC